jgi:hypothetical protein
VAFASDVTNQAPGNTGGVFVILMPGAPNVCVGGHRRHPVEHVLDGTSIDASGQYVAFTNGSSSGGDIMVRDRHAGARFLSRPPPDSGAAV